MKMIKEDNFEIVICSQIEFDQFQKGLILLSTEIGNRNFIPYIDVITELRDRGYEVKKMSKREILETAQEYGYYTYEVYGIDDQCEYFEEKYLNIVVFGYYKYE